MFLISSRKIISIAFFLLTTVAFPGSAQERDLPLSKDSDRQILNAWESRAKEFVAKNLNRFAVDRLKNYDRLLDSLYLAEKSDTLAIIESNYRTNSASGKTTIANQEKQIKELSDQKEKLESNYWSLVKKSLIAFALWITIVVALLQFRKRKLKKTITSLSKATNQLNSLEDLSSRAEALFTDFAKLKLSLQKLNSDYEKLSSSFSAGSEKADAPPEWNTMKAKSDQVKKSAGTEEKIADAVLSQTGIISDENIGTDMNDLCEQFLEIANRGVNSTEAFNCQVTRDFEKRLPSIKIKPAAVGALLLNILTNAFQSVKEKNDKGIKGYQPKISVSTRILPRFLQVRIKDNGMGMNEATLQNATSEFFSTRPVSDGSGLGLSFANSIITELHKGEIKIESEEGNSTDVYIKFFI